MKNIWILMLLVCPHFLWAYSIPVVGLDANGQKIETFLPKDDYVSRMAATLDSVRQSAVLALYWLPDGDANSEKSKWALNTFTLGISVNLSLGIGNLFGVAVNPAFTLGFVNTKIPNIP